MDGEAGGRNQELASNAGESKKSSKKEASDPLSKMKKKYLRNAKMQLSIEMRTAHFWHQLVKLVKKRNFKQVGQWLEKFYEARVRDNQNAIGGL